MNRHRARSEQAIAHLRQADPVMRRVIRRVGPFTLRLEKNRFGMLVRSVLSQQLSTAAARTIRQRVEQVAGGQLSPEALSCLRTAELRAAGVSKQKAACILALSQAAASGSIPFATIGRFSNESVIGQLTQIKGIGVWTAQMFLIFALGRLDVFPFDDLGVRSAIRNEYGLDDLPDRKTANRIAGRWRPYASVASWYCWRSLDLTRESGKNAGGNGYPT